jgi:hypothetical protein
VFSTEQDTVKPAGGNEFTERHAQSGHREKSLQRGKITKNIREKTKRLARFSEIAFVLYNGCFDEQRRLRFRA